MAGAHAEIKFAIFALQDRVCLIAPVRRCLAPIGIGAKIGTAHPATQHTQSLCASASDKKNEIMKLDFSGGPNSWFDLWHTHVDWEGDGNRSWKNREIYLKELLKLYKSLKRQLTKYPHDYQLWLAIYDLDSGKDAVYIHTKNPNADNFPLKVKGDKQIKTKNKNLKKFLEETHFELIRVKVRGTGDVYELFEKNVGSPLD